MTNIHGVLLSGVMCTSVPCILYTQTHTCIVCIHAHTKHTCMCGIHGHWCTRTHSCTHAYTKNDSFSSTTRQTCETLLCRSHVFESPQADERQLAKWSFSLSSTMTPSQCVICVPCMLVCVCTCVCVSKCEIGRAHV